MHAIRNQAYAGAASSSDITAGLQLTSFLGALLLLFVPALLLGPTFALCVRWAELDGERPGHAVGNVYLWNSLGSLMAPLFFTFLFIPVFQVPGAWILITTMAAAVGAILLRGAGTGRETGARIRLAALVGLLAGVGILWFAPSGTTGEDLVRASVVLRGKPGRQLLTVASDAVTTASVVQSPTGDRTLYTDAFAAAATGRHYRYMRMLGHLPCALSADPQRAMVIAFGTGTTAGAVAQHAEVQHLEVVEVSPAVLGLASYFEEANRFVLDDHRVDVIRDDGRNALLLHAPDLDLITLEPLMPYAPAGYPFYTREFYELARDRLREGGVLCQWVPVHAMPVGLYVAFLRAFFDVFPDGSLWFFEQSTALIGRKGHAAPDRPTVLGRLESVRQDLADAGFADPGLALSAYVASGRDVLTVEPPPAYRAYAGRPATDLDPYPEFQPTPRAPLNTPYLHQTLTYLLHLATSAEPPKDRSWSSGAEGERFKAAGMYALKGRVKQAQADYLEVGRRGPAADSDARRAREEVRLKALQEATRAYAASRRLVPGQRVIERRQVRVLRQMAGLRVRQLLARAAALEAGGEPEEARDMLILAAGMTRAVLPPALNDPDPASTDRVGAAALATAVALRLGRGQHARAVLGQARADLSDERRERPLDDLLAAVEAWAVGRPIGVPDGYGWVFEHSVACREEGLAPVRRAWDAYTAAEVKPQQAARRLAAKRLASATERQGSEVAVLHALRQRPLTEDVGVTALRAALARRIDPRDQALGRLLASATDPAPKAPSATPPAVTTNTPLWRSALIEAGWWGFLRRHPAAMDDALTSADAATRKALATAASEHGRVEVLRRVVDLLMDPDLDVRREAWSVFLQHRPVLIEGYDPRAAADLRRPLYERLKASLAP